MKQDYFEERLKKVLEGGAEHPYDQAQWNRLERRLGTSEKPVAAAWWPWLTLAFLLMLGGVIWQYASLRQQIAGLEAAIIINKKERDTVVVRTTIVYDTVIRKTIIEQRQVVTPWLPALSFGPGGSYSRNPPVFTEALSPLSPTPVTGRLAADFLANRARQQGKGLAEVSPGAFTGERATTATALLPGSPIPALPGKYPGFALPLAPASAPLPLPGPSLWQRWRPRSFAFTLGAGNLQENAFLKDDNGWQAAAGLQLNFGSSIGVKLGAELLARTFSLEEDALGDFALPSAAPDDEEDELEQISGAPVLLQLPLGLQVKVLRMGDFSVFTEGGVLATKVFPASISYTFENEDEEFYYGVTATEDNRSPLRVNAWYGRLGLRYDWQKRWCLQLSATRQQGFGTFNYAYQQPDFQYLRLAGGVRW